jgi:hypothetical protein
MYKIHTLLTRPLVKSGGDRFPSAPHTVRRAPRIRVGSPTGPCSPPAWMSSPSEPSAFAARQEQGRVVPLRLRLRRRVRRYARQERHERGRQVGCCRRRRRRCVFHALPGAPGGRCAHVRAGRVDLDIERVCVSFHPSRRRSAARHATDRAHTGGGGCMADMRPLRGCHRGRASIVGCG